MAVGSYTAWSPVSGGGGGSGGITALTGDVTASGSGSVVATLASSIAGNKTFTGSVTGASFGVTSTFFAGTAGGLNGIWLDNNATTPGGSNYNIISLGNNLYINSPLANIIMQLGGTNSVTVATGTTNIENGDCEVTTNGSGFILQSPDGTRWRIKVANTTGVLSASAA
jgi:hypothetical protein